MEDFIRIFSACLLAIKYTNGLYEEGNGMSKNPYDLDKEQRDAFFREVSRLITEKLPAEMKDFADRTGPGDNYIRLRYPGQLPYVMYELQFAKARAKNHEPYFGKKDNLVLALYLDNPKLRASWLQAMKPYKQRIEDQLGEEVVLGLWGKRYVILGKKLDSEKLEVEPEGYANEIAWFIQATFEPVWMVNEETIGKH